MYLNTNIKLFSQVLCKENQIFEFCIIYTGFSIILVIFEIKNNLFVLIYVIRLKMK